MENKHPELLTESWIEERARRRFGQRFLDYFERLELGELDPESAEQDDEK